MAAKDRWDTAVGQLTACRSTAHLFVNTELEKKNPKMIERFLRATQGWRDGHAIPRGDRPQWRGRTGNSRDALLATTQQIYDLWHTERSSPAGIGGSSRSDAAHDRHHVARTSDKPVNVGGFHQRLLEQDQARNRPYPSSRKRVRERRTSPARAQYAALWQRGRRRDMDDEFDAGPSGRLSLRRRPGVSPQPGSLSSTGTQSVGARIEKNRIIAGHSRSPPK